MMYDVSYQAPGNSHGGTAMRNAYIHNLVARYHILVRRTAAAPLAIVSYLVLTLLTFFLFFFPLLILMKGVLHGG